MDFAPEVPEEPAKDYKLRRRDTPHYLKNKRVNKEEDAEQKVLEILAQAAKQRESAAMSPVVQVSGQAGWQYWQAGRQAGWLAGKEARTQADKQASRHTDSHADSYACRLDGKLVSCILLKFNTFSHWSGKHMC